MMEAKFLKEGFKKKRIPLQKRKKKEVTSIILAEIRGRIPS